MNRSNFALFIDINSSKIPSSFRYDNASGLYLPSSSEDTPSVHKHLELVEILTIYVTLIVSIVGLVGNACTIIVLNSESMRKWRSSILLSALSAADFLYLLIIFLSIIDTLTKEAIGFHRSLILCQTTVFITHVCSFLSANYTLSFTLQRFVAVLFPLHANTIISSRSSTINILLLIFIGCSFYSFSFFLTSVSEGVCKEDENYPSLYPLLIVDTCVTFIIPFIFIVLFNCAIVYKLRTRKRFDHLFEGSLNTESYRQTRTSSAGRTTATPSELYRERQRLYSAPSDPQDVPQLPIINGRKSTGEYPPSARKFSQTYMDANKKATRYFSRLSHPRVSTLTISNDVPTPPSSNPTSSQNRQAISQRTTKMLVICSTTFLLFNSPYCAVLLYTAISKKDMTRALSVLRHFYFMSFCLNFFLYSLCGHRFRHQLILLLKNCVRKCCFRPVRSHCLRIDKIPTQAKFTRIPARGGV